MKKWVLIFFVLFFGFILSLKLRSGSVPNIFIIEAIALVIAYLLQMALRIWTVLKIKKRAQAVYGCALQCNGVCKLIFSVFPQSISMRDKDHTLNLIIIFVRRKFAKYHFASKTSVEVYRGNREAYRTGSLRYSIAKNVTWKLISSVRISGNENGKTVFILTKAPMDVTCSDKAANEYLANGDTFFDGCAVYTKKYLCRIIPNKTKNLE